MDPNPFIIPPEEQPESLNVLGIEVSVLASRATTGSREVTLQRGPANAGPPPHRHPWDESFYVLAGSVTMLCEGREQTCPRGTFVHVPADRVHAFRFGPNGGEMLEFTGSGSRATEMFTAIHHAFSTGTVEMPRALKLLAQHDIEVAA